MPDFTQMKTFVLTSELRSLAAVARKLGISPAAVSKQLTKLEEEVGLQLLVRTTRRIELTELGAAYSQQCQRILNEVDAASALVSQGKAVPQGHLKVLSARYFGNYFIVPHITEFLNLYPQIELNLELAERIPDLNSESIDVVIGMSISMTGEVIQKKIATTSYVFCASPDYLKNFGIPKKPKDLVHHRYIAHSMRFPDNELVFKTNQRVILEPYLRVNDVQIMLKLALEGVGIVMLHRYVAEKEIANGKLIELLKDESQSEIPIYVAYLQRRFVASQVRCFIDFILTKI